jgi:hypothetical protein
VVEEILGDDKNPISNIANGSVQSQSSLRSVKLVRRPGESNYLSLEPISATNGGGAESNAKINSAYPQLRLRITVPERVDIDVQGRCVDLSVSNKVLGNLNVDIAGEASEDDKSSPPTAEAKSRGGSISLDKYRGESIVIRAPKGTFINNITFSLSYNAMTDLEFSPTI